MCCFMTSMKIDFINCILPSNRIEPKPDRACSIPIRYFQDSLLLWSNVSHTAYYGKLHCNFLLLEETKLLQIFRNGAKQSMPVHAKEKLELSNGKRCLFQMTYITLSNIRQIKRREHVLSSYT